MCVLLVLLFCSVGVVFRVLSCGMHVMAYVHARLMHVVVGVLLLTVVVMLLFMLHACMLWAVFGVGVCDDDGDDIICVGSIVGIVVDVILVLVFVVTASCFVDVWLCRG